VNDTNLFLESFDEKPTPPTKKLGAGSIAILGGILVAVVVIGIALVRVQQTQPTEGKAPDFEVTTFDGETFRLSDQLGKIVVLNFWGSWCPPCRDEAPLLESLWQDYQDQGVLVVGIAYADTEQGSLNFIQEFGITYPNAPDLRTEISKNRYHIIGAPETFIIDRQGNIRRFFFQILPNTAANPDNNLFVTDASVRATLDELIAEGTTPQQPTAEETGL
jgi:cytochrome c biogenesis protein CcmG/thiol:disulfide interchange protein DsbE